MRTPNPKRLATRLEAIGYYGGKCNRCGFSDHRGLVLHEIHGGGGKWRREHRGKTLAKWLKQQGWPDIIEILCATCHQIHHYDQLFE